ncbi:MAG TPA: diguanylate cyclase [Candidatus Acidoferrum sp.]|jgi:diguanylate cyclase (GGDEF)-like protein/PAS domain S-box-containing protein
MPAIANAEFFQTVLESLHVAIYAVDRNGKIFFWNDGAERVAGYLRQEVMGRVLADNLLGESVDDGGETSPVATAIRDGKRVDAQISLRHKSGHRVPVQVSAFPIRDAHGTIIGAAQSMEEFVAVADWDRRQSKLASYGCLDDASGVLNHGMMQSHLRETLGTFAEHPVPFSILCIEIDGLAKLQARDGPGIVSTVLQVVGQTLENSLRPTDFLGRWRENQFLAILMECNGDEIGRGAERLRKMVGSSKIEWWGDRVPVTVSLGGTAVKTGDTEEGLVRRAETALLESAQQGGNCVVVRLE